MLRLKRTLHAVMEDDEAGLELQKEEALGAGIAWQALGTLDSLKLFEADITPTRKQMCALFHALTNQRCVVCSQKFRGEISWLGTYLHSKCRLFRLPYEHALE